MKTSHLILAGAATFIAQSYAMADMPTGLYIGGSISQTELIDYELYESDEWQAVIDSMRSSAGSSAVTSATINDPKDDTSETGGSLLVGLRFSQLMGFEGGLSYHGKATSEVSGQTTYTATEGEFTESLTAEAKTRTYSLKGSINLYWELTPDMEVFGKLGAHYWVREYEEELIYKLDAPNPDNSLLLSAAPDFEEKGTDPFVGLGIQWNIASDVSIRLETEYLPIDTDKRVDWDMHSYSLGVVYHFGATGPGLFDKNKSQERRGRATACDEEYKEVFKFCR